MQANTFPQLPIEELLEIKEGYDCEFKEAKNQFDIDELFKYAASIANRGGGRIVFGITDKRPRTVIGTKAFPQPEQTLSSLRENLHLDVDFYLYPTKEYPTPDKKRVLVFVIPPRPKGVPVQDVRSGKGTYWWREGDSLVPMPAPVLRKIFAESGFDYSAQICPDAQFTDLDANAIAVFRSVILKKNKNSKIADDDRQFLLDRDVIYEDGIPYCALILFGKQKSLTRLLGQSEVIFEYRTNDVAGPAQQRITFREGFFLYFDKLWSLINLRNNKQHYQNGLFVDDIPTFDERMTREALMNAVCHREYQFPGSIFIVQYPDRIIITNPGGFPFGITKENILEKQAPRNRRIAEILEKCGLVERAGQGMNLIYENSIRQAKKLPSFEGTDDYQVQITLDGIVQDPDLLAAMQRIGEETLATLTTNDFLAVNCIYHDSIMNAACKKRLPRLCDLGIIEKLPQGKYCLSREIYHKMGKRGVYTRKIGLNHNEQNALLLKHIRENTADGVRLAELCQVLPSLTAKQIQRLLEQLKAKRLIYPSGKTRASRWHYHFDADTLPGNSR